MDDGLYGDAHAHPATATATRTTTSTSPATSPSATTSTPTPTEHAHVKAALALPATHSLPVLPPRWHIRAPSAQPGLTLQTDLPGLTTTTTRHSPSDAAAIEASGIEARRPSATAPIAIQNGSFLRTAWSSASLTGSLSPGSLISSPALNALGDITPLPSPLVMSDGSPGPWQRAAPRRRSRAASGSFRDDSFLHFGRGALSPSPSLKKKGYQGLRNAAASDAGAGTGATTTTTTSTAASTLSAQLNSDAARERNRSISDYTPDPLQNIRPRHVTIGTAAHQVDSHTQQQQMRREEYVAAQRGLVPAKPPAGLPTPPASNASNRSVTESEGEDVAEDRKVRYIAVRHGPQKTRKLWRPVRQLGQGTFSKVYLATSEKTTAKDPLDENALDARKLVAIKVVEHGPAGGADEERVELSLKREVEMLRSVSHPSLVHLQAFDHDEAQALIVLTYCPGGDLFDVASDHRDILTVGLVQRIFAEMVSAVRYLHAQLIVHRDIKLENVLLNVPASAVSLLGDPLSHPYPIATLTDLGLSRRIPAPPESPLLTTRCGSEDYAAPEILLGQPYDGRSTDAWALGVLLYALMEGRLPFDPPPGKAASRSRAAHRIARCDWAWVKFGDEDGEWDADKGADWTGARQCVEGLLKKVSRGRKSLEDIEKTEWVQQGIQVEGGLKKRVEDGIFEEDGSELSAR